MSKQAAAVDRYIKGFQKNVQVILKKVRQTIKAVIPQAQEMMKYGIPTFQIDNKNVVHFGAWQTHVGFYPTPDGISAFKKEFSKYKSAKGSVQFPLDKPMPLALIKRVVRFRLDQITKKTAAKKAASASHIHRHKDGSIWAKGQLRNGKMEGDWEWFRKDGTKMRSGSFKNGKQTGTWTTYDKEGKVVKITQFK